MTIHLIAVPYHLGHRNIGVGGGPTRLLEGGAAERAGGRGREVMVTTVEYAGRTHEIGATFEINALLAERVRETVDAGHFPLVLAGNCNSCLGTLGGVANGDTGVVWFDAHGDFNSPESTTGGFFDGFALNIAVGGSWRTAVRSIPGFRPVREADVLLTGVRDLDHGEEELIRASAITVFPFPQIDEHGLASFIEHLAIVTRRTKEFYVHVDLDVLDGDAVPANEFSPPGGLSCDALGEALSAIRQHCSVRAASVNSYNPQTDVEGKALDAALEVIEMLAALST